MPGAAYILGFVPSFVIHFLTPCCNSSQSGVFVGGPASSDMVVALAAGRGSVSEGRGCQTPRGRRGLQ